eukprot:Skav200660  [mRNA]  locus=scaffold3198:66885:72542:- [translate_table: standard]
MTCPPRSTPLVPRSVFSPNHPPKKVEVHADQQDSGSCLQAIIARSATPSGDREPDEVMLVIRSSVWINFVLMLCKLYTFLISGSLAVLASLVDSIIKHQLSESPTLWQGHLGSTKLYFPARPSPIMASEWGRAATEEELKQRLPTLYVYDHCPFCVRARMIFGLKKIPFTLHFLMNDDVVTPTKMTGKKVLPILEMDGEALAESLDIVAKIDAIGTPMLAKAADRKEIDQWLNDNKELIRRGFGDSCAVVIRR